ncbi:MAG: hypothetical protein IT348_11330 [Candidatus Eisenbacteria bacterium]|nr:hypothetical protein [Candidatus Eisenbacteria bacterium]
MTRPVMCTLALLCLLTIGAAVAPRAAHAETKAFVYETDYSTGRLAAATLQPRALSCDVADTHQDATLRYFDGLLYVVNRFGGDNVQVIHPATYATLRQFSVGNGANPHDIAFASPTKAYVTRYETNDLWVVNPATGAHTGTISLAAFRDADGYCEMDRLHLVGPLLFVSLERIDRDNGYVPDDSGLVAVIDTRTDALVDCDPVAPGTQAIRLQLTNPFTAFQFDPLTSRLMIGCAGAFGALDGGVEWIDPVLLASGGVAVTEAALGGDVNDVVWGSAAKSWAITSEAGGNSHFVTWSAATGAKLATLWSPGAYSLTDAERAGDELWVCSNAFMNSRVRVFSAASGAVLGSDLLCSLPPVAVTFDAPSAQVASVVAEQPRVSLSLPHPSPARRSTAFSLTLAEEGEARIEAFDAAGRRVRTLLSGARPAGTSVVHWDLADDGGSRLPAGLYLVRAAASGAVSTRRVLVLP